MYRGRPRFTAIQGAPMTETIPGPNEFAEAPEMSREELATATDVLLAMVKTSKGLKMYLPNNPLVTRFIEELKGKMNKHLANYGDFKLDIDQFELRYKGKVVYENREPKESIAFKMYIDGIRYLIFSEGIEEYELCDFLDIIGKDRPGDVDDDIVTLLWEKNLPHLTYILAEDFLEFDGAGGSMGGAASQQEKISGIYRSITSLPTPPPMTIVSQNILVLTAEEAEWLKKAREADEKRKPLDEVIQILTSILIGEKDREVFGEFVDIMAKLAENLVKSEEMGYALNLVRFLGNLAKNEQVPADKRDKISDSIRTIFSQEAAEALAGIIDKTELLSPEELSELLHTFGKPAITRICQLLVLVEKMKMRKAIIQALVEIGYDTPEVFAQYLSDPRWYVVRNMAFILARIAHPGSLDSIVKVLSHRELRIRKEVLNYLERTPDQKAKNYLLKFLRDDSSVLRIRALQVLAHSKCTFALNSIAAMVASEQFQEKGIDEKKAIYEALGELGGERMLPLFREMILKKYWFNKAKEKESVFYAVAGLVKMKSESALRLLEEAHAVKSDEMRDMIDQASAALAAEYSKKGTGP